MLLAALQQPQAISARPVLGTYAQQLRAAPAGKVRTKNAVPFVGMAWDCSFGYLNGWRSSLGVFPTVEVIIYTMDGAISEWSLGRAGLAFPGP